MWWFLVIPPQHAHLWFTTLGPVIRTCIVPRGLQYHWRGWKSLLPHATIYEDATKGFNRFRRTNLCGVSPIHLDIRSLTPATLLAKVSRREKLLMCTVSPESSLSYHRPHRSDGLIKHLLRPGRLRSRVHFVVLGRSKLRPALGTGPGLYCNSTSRKMSGLRCVLALPLNFVGPFK